VFIGLDIGSVSCKAVLMSGDTQIMQTRYRRMHGQPMETALAVLEELLNEMPQEHIAGIAVTGSGGGLVAETLACFSVNEIIAQSRATAVLHPEIRTVIEMGGEDAKLIRLEADGGSVRLKDMSMNTVCAAGTGSFLDQQAARLGISIEGEFGRLALASQHPPRIAGRCSVFAKSDMIHLQQAASPDSDIVMGLCLALARNFKSTVIKNIELVPPIAFQGGVAANAGMVRAFENVLDLGRGELVIPDHFAFMGAIGAVLCLLERGVPSSFAGTAPLTKYLQNRTFEARSHSPLVDDRYPIFTETQPISAPCPVDAWLGIDVGSISTNLVVIDRAARVLARRYLMTAGRPIEAVRQGLDEIGLELGDKAVIRGATTTGSGRYLIGDFIGADFVKNEITAHARGSASINPEVDTIFEIGGQDSKYISLRDGAVVDFTMNKVCAAGTGSFLEEQAEKLGVAIKDEFGRLALSSRSPSCLGERCTVFMESSLTCQQQQGAAREDLVAGLSYSIALNYLNRVVEDRPVGDVIFFQGGTAYNRGVKAAFEKICGKPITVPPHHDVLGALGSALIAREGLPQGPSRFKGFDLAHRGYEVSSFECHDCPNTCEIRRVSIEGEEPLHYGSRCGKFDEEQKTCLGDHLPRLFAEHDNMLCAPYKPSRPLPEDAPTVGMPRATIFYDMYPYWQAFFAELGLRLVLSPVTNRAIINRGCELVAEETCFPMKVAQGHVADLLEKGVDYLFLPCVVNMDHASTDASASYNCLYIQSLPWLADAALQFKTHPVKVLRPVLHFEWGAKVLMPELKALGRDLGRNGACVSRAAAAANRELQSLRKRLTARGRQVLESLPPDTPVLVIVSRPYNGCDQGLNFRIPDKLRDLGALALPLDFLPMPEAFGEPMKKMYWRNGQRILAAARTVRQHPRLHAVYLTNFGCGPDSFIMKYFSREMQGKPWLALEIDEHSADAGVITRLEAFLDSLASHRQRSQSRPADMPRHAFSGNHRTVYVPYMDDHGLALAAAMRHCGVAAEALPMSDERSVELGRRYTSGKECYPCILTTGDIVKKTLAPDFVPERSSFFMPTAMGPCRFGQYSRHHRMVLDDLGLHDVPIVLLDQTTGLEQHLQGLGSGFRALAWQSLILIDYLKKLLLQTRPYERSRGDSDSFYGVCLQRLTASLERSGTLGDCAQHAAAGFAAIGVERKPRPLIGIIGEIYVRSNQFSNACIIRRVEALGGEAVMPGMQEWVEYTDWERRRDLRREGAVAQYGREWLTHRVQNHFARRIGKTFTQSIRHFPREAGTPSIMACSAPYLSEHVRGEANLSLGRAVEYALHGCSGIVNLMPFACMPGTIVNALLGSFSRDWSEVPVLKLVFDGTPQAGDQTRLEAFMHQAGATFKKSTESE
jgi:predicted CoA-substrate-specific enzyme activase